MNKVKIGSLFLIAYYVAHPNNKRFTHVPGYITNEENIHRDEQVIVARSVKIRDMQRASVVLDITNKRIVKCRSQPKPEFDGLWSYYKKNYADYLEPLIAATDPTPTISIVPPSIAESSSVAGTSINSL